MERYNRSIPINQHRVIDPYIQRIKQYDTFDSQIYLSHAINQLLSVYGDDFVVNGFYPTSVDFKDGVFEIVLCGGVFIQDGVMIQVFEDIHLLIDVSEFDADSGYIIIHPDYTYLDSPTNEVRIVAQFMDVDGHYIRPYGWMMDRNRLFFDIYKIKLNDNKIEQPSIAYLYIAERIYYYRGFNNNRLYRLDYNINKHYDVYNIPYRPIQSPMDPLIFGDVDRTKYTSLVMNNCNIINSRTSSQKYDQRYFGHKFVVNDLVLDQSYNLSCTPMNLILDVNEEPKQELKRSVVRNLSLHDYFEKREYVIRANNGNLILEEEYG